MSDKQAQSRALAWMAQSPWAIERAALDQVLAIATREHTPDFSAVLARQGEQLARTENVQVRNDVAVLSINGPIFRYANLFSRISGATSIESVALDFREALDNPRVRGIVLTIDSPGGNVAGISDFAKHVREGSKRKPVVAFIDGMGASAAYWIASAATWVVVSDTAAAGSIGVVAGIRVADDATLVEIVSSQSPNKRLDPRTDRGKQALQETVDQIAGVFVDAVANYRNVPAATVLRDFGAGGVKIGQHAVDARMADEIGTLEQLIASMSAGEHPAITFMKRLRAAHEAHAASASAAAPAPASARSGTSPWSAVVSDFNSRSKRNES